MIDGDIQNLVKAFLQQKEDEILVKASRLSLAYGPTLVLTGVDLTVRDGEFWFLVGPNGAGKSTLLKALAGLLMPRQGDIRLHPGLVSRQLIGVVPQQCSLNPDLPLTVREFVLMGLVGIPLPRTETAQRIEWALDKTGLHGQERRSYHTLSGGERQRTLVARALARMPKLLLMDEPTGGLDFALSQRLMDYLGRLNREDGMTIVSVSHDLFTAMMWGTHVGLVHGGGVETGAPSELLSPDVLLRVYGRPLVFGEA